MLPALVTIGTTSNPDWLIEDVGRPAPRVLAPDEEAVVAYGAASELVEWGLERYGHFHRRQELPVLRAMMRTPAAQSAFWTLKSTVLAGGFEFLPAGRPGEDGDPDPLADEREQLLEECRESARRMEGSLETIAWEMLDAVGERVKLAEHVQEAVPEGPSAGLYALKAVKFKPRWAWRFRVDPALNVTAIDAWTVRQKWERLDARHFTWLAWDAREADPRGHSCLDAAFHAFNVLNQLWPEAYQGWSKFSFPSTFFTTGEHETGDVPVRDASGQYTGRTESPESRLARAGALMRGGATVAARYGAQAKVIESSRDGQMIEQAIKLLEAQIIVCVLLQTRAIREAEFGSKADAENGTGVAGTFAQYVRHWLCPAIRRPFMATCEANHGAEVARRSTPLLSLGRIDARNFAAIAQAIGVLYQSGFFTSRQLLWLDNFMGLPPRSPGDERVGPQLDSAAAPAAAPPPAAAALMDAMGEIKAHLLGLGMPSGGRVS